MTAKHIHKLRKHKYSNGTHIYFCTLPDCHYKIEVALALGKESLCNICNEPFIMNKKTLKLQEPHCINCGRVVVIMDGRKHFVNKRSAAPEIMGKITHDFASELEKEINEVIGEPEEGDI